MEMIDDRGDLPWERVRVTGDGWISNAHHVVILDGAPEDLKFELNSRY